MSDLLLAVVFIIVILVIAYYVIKNLSVLLINAVLGLICLFILNTLNVMQWVGKPELGYGLATILIAGIGGLPGVFILILLNLFGITV